ncbi:SusD/RagB family nutrient-binding outer membrane lipoprotein [Mucilaginibacter sp. SP1R1]|uniref:SusD/RagB family nutrient-binding outer membrane lipoprotein n=1 Tax=Mucilaginibacter sp. SP1R1 TaxID=2723091 RepID=UPI00161A7817|nr:SusD/RagB family nutrient-binding outer membrane lipoprotein [Mucilaginibacter sp. SP1R1]MBB6151570.1 hypothetical protein [Mucilaginibacter sp. SP1R1]
MKKISIIFVLVSLLSACTKDLTKLNTDPKNPGSVPSYTLFTNAQRVLTNTVVSASVNSNIFRLIEQQWTETQYLNETNYQLPSRRQPDLLWTQFYTNTLINFEKAKEFMLTDVADAGTRKNETAITDILEVYAYYYLVTTFGNIPYTQALDITKPFPVYDDQKTIYYALLTRLDADIAALDPAAGSFGSSDLVYAGDIGQWTKFANTFKLKMGILLADVDVAKSKTVVEAAVKAGVFTSNADNALYNYDTTPPNTNPIWVDLVQSQRHDFIATTEFMAALQVPATGVTSGFADPRVPYYFAPNAAGVYIGAPNGSGNGSLVYSKYSLPSGPLLTPGSIGSVTNPGFKGVLLDYSETEFNLAEAVSRGFAVSGTTQSHYNAAITASISYWTGGSAATYLALPKVNFATATGTDLQKIAAQEYLAFYNRGWDAWTTNRRLDYPALVPPENAYSAFPVRFTYPISEQNVNESNFSKAGAAIGGDKVTTRLFFDVK